MNPPIEVVAAVERLIAAGSVLFPDGIPPAWLGANFEAHGLVAGPSSRLSLAVRWHGPNAAVLWEVTGDPVTLTSAGRARRLVLHRAAPASRSGCWRPHAQAIACERERHWTESPVAGTRSAASARRCRSASPRRGRSSASCGPVASTSSSASTRSAAARGPDRSPSAPPSCRGSAGSTASATRRCSPSATASGSSTGSPVGARRGASGTHRRSSATSSAWRKPSGWPTRRALDQLPVSPDAAIVDGSWDFVTPQVAHVERVIKADARCLVVSAASILAKVTRDRLMREHAEHYPPWSFDTNKGYPCATHLAALQAWGPSTIHRRSWVFMDHYVPWPSIQRIAPCRRGGADPDAVRRAGRARR